MTWNFDAPFCRKDTDSVKWDINEQVFGRKDVLSLWVADMDFPAPQQVSDAICARAAHGAFGYTIHNPEFYDVFIRWAQRRYGWKIPREWMVDTHGVVEAINNAVQAFTQPGDKICIQTPVYPPFFKSVQLNERQLVTSPLMETDAGYMMDFADLEAKFADGVKILIFCSPHNPVGRVWHKDELEQLTILLKKYNVLLISDEIHADIIFPGNTHTPIASLDDALLQRSITLYAPSKTFNIAGLTTAVTIIPNEALRTQFNAHSVKLGDHIGNVLGLVGFTAAYKHGEPWLEALNEYLFGNYEFVRNYLAEHIPAITVTLSEGTFLLWLDCRELNMKPKELTQFFVHKAGLGLNEGTMFGKDGAGFMRLNIACRRALLQQALEQLKDAVRQLI